MPYGSEVPFNGAELKVGGWKAKWIWKSGEIRENDFAFFRKEFYIGKAVESAKVYVSAHNHFELFVNGTKVSGYVVPAPTCPQKSKYYLCYQVKDMLKTGCNIFCATVHYIGGGGQNYVDGLPGFILQCDIAFKDDTREVLVTDGTWRAQCRTPYMNGSGFQQSRKLSAIEDYDARKEEKGWLGCGFDDSRWDEALLSPVNEKGWVLKLQAIPEGKIYEVITPVPSALQEPGVQVFDAGKIITGWPRLTLEGMEGVQVRTRYSEELDEAGRVRHNVCNEKSENYYDQYTMKGEKEETWEPCFSYKAFRYVEVTGYPAKLTPQNIKIISAGTGLHYEGFFHSSDKLLNDIYEACIQTQKNNVVGQMVDCPHREQAQYLADSDLQAETFIYSFKDPSVIEKVLLDFKDAQNGDGSFPFVYPTNSDNSRFDINIPEWDLHFITLLWKEYFYYDNRNILESCYETAKRTVNHYLGLRDETSGLVPKAGDGTNGWNISDWPYPGIDGKGKYLTVQNCLLYHTTETMSRIAAVLGLEEDAAEFSVHSSMLKESIVRQLYRPDKKCFIDSYGSDQSHQGTNTVAYQYGLVPEDDKKAVLEFIVSRGFTCSTLLSLNLLQVLFENGKGREAYGILRRTDQPGWGYMISKGYKTVWEGFRDIESHCHAWNAYPARIFVQYLVGIRAAAPSFKEISIMPYIAPGMKYAEGKVPTVRGEVFVRWEKENEEISVDVFIPPEAYARVFIPKAGREVDECGGCGDCIIFGIGPGRYMLKRNGKNEVECVEL